MAVIQGFDTIHIDITGANGQNINIIQRATGDAMSEAQMIQIPAQQWEMFKAVVEAELRGKGQ